MLLAYFIGGKKKRAKRESEDHHGKESGKKEGDRQTIHKT